MSTREPRKNRTYGTAKGRDQRVHVRPEVVQFLREAARAADGTYLSISASIEHVCRELSRLRANHGTK